MINPTCRLSGQIFPVRFIMVIVLLLGAVGCGPSPPDSVPADGSNAAAKPAAPRGPAVPDETKMNANTPPQAPTGPSNGMGGVPAAAGGSPQTSNLPEGVPDYPGVIRVESLRIASKGSEVKAPQGVVMFVSSEPDPMKVAAWYEKELMSAGWVASERSGDGEFCLLQKAGREMSVSVSAIPEPKPDGHTDANLLIVIDAN